MEKLKEQKSLDAADLLRNELSRRISKNPKYSLRAFARTLGVSPATLSLLISRKQPISYKTLNAVSKVLNLSPEQTQILNAQINSRRFGFFSESLTEKQKYNYTTVDIFKVMSEWYYYGILSLLNLKDSSIDPKWISKKLGISVFEAQEAIERLQKLELIINVKGRWKQSFLPIRIDDVTTSSAARRFQKQLLLKAIDSLENDPADKRDISGMTMAINHNDLPLAVKRIEEFRRKLAKELEFKKKPNSVYNLTIQFVPLTKESCK